MSVIFWDDFSLVRSCYIPFIYSTRKRKHHQVADYLKEEFSLASLLLCDVHQAFVHSSREEATILQDFQNLVCCIKSPRIRRHYQQQLWRSTFFSYFRISVVCCFEFRTFQLLLTSKNSQEQRRKKWWPQKTHQTNGRHQRRPNVHA